MRFNLLYFIAQLRGILTNNPGRYDFFLVYVGKDEARQLFEDGLIPYRISSREMDFRISKRWILLRGGNQ